MRRTVGWLARSVRTLVLIALPITIVMIVSAPTRTAVLNFIDTVLDR